MLRCRGSRGRAPALLARQPAGGVPLGPHVALGRPQRLERALAGQAAPRGLGQGLRRGAGEMGRGMNAPAKELAEKEDTPVARPHWHRFGVFVWSRSL